MPKPNVLTLKSPAGLTEKFGPFTDPTQPETPIAMNLQMLGGAAYYQYAARKAELVRIYITGDNGNPPMEFPPVGLPPRSIKITEGLLDHIAMLDVMQTATDESERFGVIELAAINEGMPYAWGELLGFAQRLNSKRFEAEKKEVTTTLPDPTGEVSSPSAPDSIQGTPSISSEPMPYNLEPITSSGS